LAALVVDGRLRTSCCPSVAHNHARAEAARPGAERHLGALRCKVLDSSRVTRRGAEPRRCRVADLDGDTEEADMTDDPNPEPVRDLSARADMAALLRDVPVVKDIKDFAVPGVFETDEELDDFLNWYQAERQANLA
jgi:hypothetical protein